MIALLFWICVGLVIYIYIGYPLLIGWLARTFGREPDRKPIRPRVSFLIPAYNEQAHIEAKLRNSLALDYPRELLEIVVANDGSTDRTVEIIGSFAGRGIRMESMPSNIGKTAMLGRVMPSLSGEIVVFSDTSSQLEPSALLRLVENFADPRVGCVSGLYRLLSSDDDLRGQGEGLYWRYETGIKAQESRLHSILGAHGAFYAIRRELFAKLKRGSVNDDYLIPMRIVQQGFRAVYDPRAVAWERESASIGGEFARRKRIAVGNCQQMVELREMLHPRYGWVAFSFFSHKVLRTLAPVFLLALLLLSFGLPTPWRMVSLSLQFLLYGSAALGYICQRSGYTVRWLAPPLYFTLGNLAMLAGLWIYLFRRRSISWGTRA